MGTRDIRNARRFWQTAGLYLVGTALFLVSGCSKNMEGPAAINTAPRGATSTTPGINLPDPVAIRTALAGVRDPKEIAELTVTLAEGCPSSHGQCMGVFLSSEEIRVFARNRSAAFAAISARIDSAEPLKIGLLDLMYFLADDPGWRPQVLQWLEACQAHGQQFFGANLGCYQDIKAGHPASELRYSLSPPGGWHLEHYWYPDPAATTAGSR